MNGEQSSHGGWYRYEYAGGMLKEAGEESGAQVESTYFADGSHKSVKTDTKSLLIIITTAAAVFLLFKVTLRKPGMNMTALIG